MANENSFTSVRPVTQNYEYDHFAGSQISIYIGDVLVDEINRIEFNVQQSKKPIYGFASQYYDAMASGQVLVSGSFTINFKEAGYMHLILKRYFETLGSIEDVNSPFKKNPNDTSDITKSEVLRRNVERILADEAKAIKDKVSGNSVPVSPQDKFEFYTDLAALPDSEFENIAEIFEDKLWQNKSANEENLGNVTKPINSDLDKALHRADQFSGFTIWITYGDINNKIANHTIRKLTGVHVIGSSQVIEISGEPVLEQYQFLARNLL